MTPTNRVAVALGLEDTAAALDALRRLDGLIGLAEIRLDLMRSFDLERLITAAPCPLIITCRPQREGGAYPGGDTERLQILTQASALNCDYVDVEWDCVDKFENRGPATRVIVSRHDYRGMPQDLERHYLRMREQGDVVKLVGFASGAGDAIAMLRLTALADTPVIAIAMGEAGAITRLMAPCFEACLLTYGSIDRGQATAPGQISVEDMVNRYALDRAGPRTDIIVYLYTDPALGPDIDTRCGGDGRSLRLAMRVEPEQLQRSERALKSLSPRVTPILR